MTKRYRILVLAGIVLLVVAAVAVPLWRCWSIERLR